VISFSFYYGKQLNHILHCFHTWFFLVMCTKCTIISQQFIRKAVSTTVLHL